MDGATDKEQIPEQDKQIRSFFLKIIRLGKLRTFREKLIKNKAEDFF